MNHSIVTALVSMQAIQQKLDVIAHNIANVNTTGFKRREASFQDILTNVYGQPPAFAQEGRLTPLGLPQGWGAKIGQIELSLEQGTLNMTGNPLDFGIEGNGLFEVQLNSVDDEGNPNIGWTRDGAFQLTYSPDNPDVLVLATARGELVLSTEDEPIEVPSNHALTIDGEGRLFARDNSSLESEPIFAGQLKMVRAVRPQVLINEGNNVYRLPPGQAADDILEEIDLATNNANDQTKVSVKQGFLEQSNVNLTDEMTELMTVQRAYQLTARAIVSGDAMMGLTNSLRA